MGYLIALVIGAVAIASTVIFFGMKGRRTIESKDREEISAELEGKVEKLLKMRGYKVVGKKKLSYNLVYNKRIAEVRLEKSLIVKKQGKKYIMLINKDEEKFTENKEFRKKVLEYSYGSNLKGLVVVNGRDKSIDVINFYNKREKELSRMLHSLLIVVTVMLTLNIFFLLAFLFKS